MISVVATGTIQLSDDTNDIATPNGAKSGRYAANAALKNVLAGGLIGRIGPTGTPFGIGENATFAAPASGLLYLGVNDDGYGDNRGSFQVQVTVK
jgi:hypothetical protein